MNFTTLKQMLGDKEDNLLRLKFEKGKQKELLDSYKKFKKCQNRKDFSDILGVKLGSLKRWSSEENTLPNIIFKKIYPDFKEAKKFEEFIVEKLPKNWGAKKGAKIRMSQIKDKKEYYRGLRIIKDAKRTELHKNLRKKIKTKSNEAIKIIKNNIDLNCVIATYVLTDGSLMKQGESHNLGFYTKDSVLRDLIFEILVTKSKYVPSITKEKKKEVYSIRITDNKLAGKLLKLSNTYKKIPKKDQKKKDYLNEVQPSLNFLKKTDNKTREYCIRLAFTTDGSISLAKNGVITLSLSCHHPTLGYEWIEILRICGVKSTIIKSKKSWCGISGVRVSNKSIKRFHDLGGFIEGVKISKKSKKYREILKNELLKIVLNKLNS
jgi:hypothetical protein